MQPRLVGKGGGADIGRLAQRHTVEDFVQLPADRGERPQAVARDAGLIAAGIGFLEQQGRDERGQIGIATALAQPVERTLNLAHARIHRRKAARHRIAGVVMGVDAKAVAGDTCRYDL